MKMRNSGLIIAAIILVIASLLIGGQREGAEFAGADGQAMDTVTSINPNYQPWFSPIWQPPSGEVESLLFALQAALGAGVLCYYLGFKRGQAQGRRNRADADD